MQAISSITTHRAHEPLEGDLAKRARRAYIAGWAFWIVFIPLLACPLFALMLIGMVENTYDFEWFTQHITIASHIYFLLLLLPGLILTIIAIWARQCRQWGWREPAEMRFARKLFERARQRIESHLREGERVIAFTIALPLYNGALSDAVVAVIAFCGIGWWTLCQFIAPRIRSIYGSGIPPIWWFDVTNTIIPSLVYIGALVALLILVRILHPGSSVHVASSLIYATACAIMSFAMMVNMRVKSTQFYIIATVVATIGVAIFATMHAVDIAMKLLMRSYRIIVRTNNTWRLFAASLLGRVKPLNNGQITVERWCEKLNGVELKIAMREASRASYYKLLFPNRSLANDFVNAV
ncbi:MAG TPA: hypothetical protein EYP10_09105, partial [Armatimonadetes bacterium]|nr:hypothetical protein [Armatimonadota bacterium]